MKNKQLYRAMLTALLMALTIVCGRFFLLPIPWTHGNINLSDASILIAAALLGPLGGGIVGGVGTAFLDLISGYAQYAPFSLLAHGLEGILAGWCYQRWGKTKLGQGKTKLGQWSSLAVGALVMVGGYFLADSFLYTWVAGFLGIGTNLLQGLAGIIVAQLILPALKARWQD